MKMEDIGRAHSVLIRVYWGAILDPNLQAEKKNNHCVFGNHVQGRQTKKEPRVANQRLWGELYISPDIEYVAKTS